MKRDDIKIIIVDDEEIIVDELSFFLQEYGFSTIGFSDSKEASDYLKKNQCDILITDLKMPEVTGMELVKELNSLNSEALPIIITGYATAETAIEAIQNRVYDFIRKPFKFGEILHILNRAVDHINLRYENKKLTLKVETMLDYMTMLFDISNLLFQISDLQTVQTMIMDTLSEGLKLKKAGLLLKDSSTGDIKVVKSLNMSEQFDSQFYFKIDDTINNHTLDLEEPIILSEFDNGLTISGRNIQLPDDISECTLIPINFSGNLKGFLAVFERDISIFDLHDGLKLLKVFTTQIAPLFESSFKAEESEKDKQKVYEQVLYNIFEDNIQKAVKLDTPVVFAQLKMMRINLPTIKPDLNQIQERVRDILIDEVSSACAILWLDHDSILLIEHEGNPVNMELSCTAIRSKIEDLYLTPANDPVINLLFGTATYPREGKTPIEIQGKIKEKLINSIPHERSNATNSSEK